MRIELTHLCKTFGTVGNAGCGAMGGGRTGGDIGGSGTGGDIGGGGAPAVLNGLDLDLNFRSLAVIGPSGGGKSTLLRILGGLIPPSSGQVALDSEPLRFDERSLREHLKKTGFVFQSRGLFPHLTALQNILLPLVRVFRISQKEAEALAWQYLKRFMLENEANKYPWQLSGGQSQRVSIARAVAIKPRLLLLDEPTSALDPELTGEVLDVIHELKQDDLNIILVTHEMGFARSACDQVIFLADGRLVESGPGQQLFSEPQTKELKAFLGKVLEWRM